MCYVLCPGGGIQEGLLDIPPVKSPGGGAETWIGEEDGALIL